MSREPLGSVIRLARSHRRTTGSGDAACTAAATGWTRRFCG
ncbi:hypothetical protein [Saccharopolyspora gregorii]